jgi:hypothetical protein
MYTPPADEADEPEHIARFLTEPIAATWRGFDRGRAVADEFFAAQEDREYDPHLWAHLARYEAVLSLRREHSDIRASDRQWDLRLPHHSGIEIVKDPFRIRVCKAVGDSPQNPGRNRSRKEFFQQLGFSLFAQTGANLILYWRVRSDELDLGLCKPKGLWRFRGQPKLEWRCPVHFDPLAGLTFPTADEDVDVFRLDEAETGETGTGE